MVDQDDTPRRGNRFDLAATLAAKAAGRAAGMAMDEKLKPVSDGVVSIMDRLDSIERKLVPAVDQLAQVGERVTVIDRRLGEEPGPTVTLDELTQMALEEIRNTQTEEKKER